MMSSLTPRNLTTIVIIYCLTTICTVMLREWWQNRRSVIVKFVDKHDRLNIDDIYATSYRLEYETHCAHWFAYRKVLTSICDQIGDHALVKTLLQTRINRGDSFFVKVSPFSDIVEQEERRGTSQLFVVRCGRHEHLIYCDSDMNILLDSILQ